MGGVWSRYVIPGFLVIDGRDYSRMEGMKSMENFWKDQRDSPQQVRTQNYLTKSGIHCYTGSVIPPWRTPELWRLSGFRQEAFLVLLGVLRQDFSCCLVS